MLPDGFLAFINEHHLFAPTDAVLLAVSGGIDSVVLADLLITNGFTVGIAHVNFGLRGADSDADAAFVANMAQQYGVPFHLTHVDTVAEANRRGESIQVTARQLRYTWFHELQQQFGYVAVATAHHLNDVLETMLLNLTRGTGLAGLRGMPIQSAAGTSGARVVRPLWFASRPAIEAYAQVRGLAWREDRSNAKDDYSRNRIRHWVIPQLEQINPSLLGTLPRTLTQLRAADALLQHEMARSFSACTQPTSDGFSIDLSALAQLPEPLFRLGEWLRPYGFTPDVLAQCWQAVAPDQSAGRNGQVFMAPMHRLLHDRGTLWLLPHRSLPEPADPLILANWPSAPIRLGTSGSLAVEHWARTAWDERWPNDPALALLDAETVPFPWTLRPARTGDRFKPLGMTGSRLLSDFLADQKLPLRDRAPVWVLESGGRIAWVLGLRPAQPVRVTDKTRHLVRLYWKPAPPSTDLSITKPIQ